MIITIKLNTILERALDNYDEHDSSLFFDGYLIGIYLTLLILRILRANIFSLPGGEIIIWLIIYCIIGQIIILSAIFNNIKIEKREEFFFKNVENYEYVEDLIEKEYLLKNKYIQKSIKHELGHRKINDLFKLESRCFIDFFLIDYSNNENQICQDIEYYAYCENNEKESLFSYFINLFRPIFHFIYEIIEGGSLIFYAVYMLNKIFNFIIGFNNEGVSNPNNNAKLVYKFEF